MTRANLRAVKPCRKPQLAMVKKAIRLFRGDGVPREVVHANARKWIASMRELGDRHILNRNAPAKWGQPGQTDVRQVYAPRRMGT